MNRLESEKKIFFLDLEKMLAFSMIKINSPSLPRNEKLFIEDAHSHKFWKHTNVLMRSLKFWIEKRRNWNERHWLKGVS